MLKPFILPAIVFLSLLSGLQHWFISIIIISLWVTFVKINVLQTPQIGDFIFILCGIGLECFKLSHSNWSYTAALFPSYVPFLYAAVASYAREARSSWRLECWHRPNAWKWLALAMYINFFTLHYIPDIRWGLFLAVILVCFKTPKTLLFLLGSATLLWIAENLGTYIGAWKYPNQHKVWELVEFSKWFSWLFFFATCFAIQLVESLYIWKKKPLIA